MVNAKMNSISYDERKSRAKEIIKRVEKNDLKKELRNSIPSLKNADVRLKWIDQMFDTRAIMFHLWGDFCGFHINVLGEKDIEDLIKGYDELTDQDIISLTKKLILEMKKGVIWQYNKLKKKNPKELKEIYREMAQADRRDLWGTNGSS